MPPKASARPGRAKTTKTRTKAAARPPSEEMLRKLAHELRTPIGAIATRAEVMRDEKFGPLGDDHYRTYAATIHDTANYALGVLMRAIARAGGSFAQPDEAVEDTSLTAVVTRTVGLVQPFADDAGVRIIAPPAVDALNLRTDPSVLAQILINLLNNAIKFTPPGGEVRIEASRDAADVLTLDIIDTGVGIGPRELARLQAAGSEHGYGYHMIHELVACCGSDVELDITSVRGEGTRVTLTIPTAEVAS